MKLRNFKCNNKLYPSSRTILVFLFFTITYHPWPAVGSHLLPAHHSFYRGDRFVVGYPTSSVVWKRPPNWVYKRIKGFCKLTIEKENLSQLR